MAKKTKAPTEGLSLADELRALDHKQRNFRRDLEPHLQKKLSPYLLMRYAASVEGSVDLQTYYLLSTNENVNKNFFDLGGHPELQWLTCTTVSPGLGSFRHYWLGAKKKESSEKTADSIRKQVAGLCPTWKSDEIDLFIKINSTDEILEWLASHGVENK